MLGMDGGGVSRERAEFNAKAQRRKGRKTGNGVADFLTVIPAKFLTVIPAKAGIHSVEHPHP